jgi:predicted Zn-dependent protease
MMIERLVTELSRCRGVDDWQVATTELQSEQAYFIGDRTESVRSVQTHAAQITVYNDHPLPTAEGTVPRRGTYTFTVLPSGLSGLRRRLHEAVMIAQSISNPPYPLVEPTHYPSVPIADPCLVQGPHDTIHGLRTELLNAVKNEANVKLATTEIILDIKTTHLFTSRGIDASHTGTALLVEFTLTSRRGGAQSESTAMVTRRRISDISVPEIVGRHAAYATHSINARLPKTGLYDVVITEEALVDLFRPFIVHSSAQTAYKGYTRFKRGEDVLSGYPVKGDHLTLIDHGTLPYGTKSAPFDRDGYPMGRRTIIKDGILKRFWGDQQYATYLGVRPTGFFANLEVSPGTIEMEDLLQDGPVLHITSFSDMEPNSITGEFVGEIRLGYLHNGNTITPIKGGSLNGNVFQAFSSAQFSRDIVFLGDYRGPKAIRFSQLSVAGRQ